MLTSFIITYRNSLLQSIGCASPWNPLSNNSLPICTSPISIFAYEDHYFDLSYQYKREIVRLTGCSLPCRYRQYSLAKSGAPAPSQMSSGDVLLWYASTDLVKEEEELIFPFESMVSELGGALGLFLGFSFFGLFDSVFVALHTIFAKLFPLNTKHWC